MPDVRTFRAASMREALEAVRSDLGSEAVILKTRQVPAKRSLLGLRRGVDEYEITAGLGIEPRRKRKPGSAVPSSAAPSSAGAHRFLDEPEPPPLLNGGPAMTIAERKAADIVRELTERDLPSPLTSRDAVRDTIARQAPAAGPHDLDPGDRLAVRLDVLGRQLERLRRADRTVAPADLPPTLRPHYERLIAADVEPDVASEIVSELPVEGSAADDREGVLQRAISNRLSCAGELPVGSTRPYVTAVVGPTGVGKTTTVAKLAARYAFDRGHRVGLVTVDTQRVGAVDQLRAYAEVMRLPLEVVNHASEMPDALARLSDRELVLIDTAGRSPRDDAGIRELAGVLGAERVDEVVLALSLSASLRSSSSAADRFGPLAPASLIVTKLDEAEGPGPILSIIERTRLPLRYVTDGQEVPGDIEAAKPAALADRLSDAASGVRL